MAQLASGIDGLFVEVDDENINNCVVPLPQNQTPPELEYYYRQVQQDKDKGNILAPFTRGEATRSTATEIAALASYSSNEIGRLARERDQMIEQLATTYINILTLYLQESGEKDIVYIDGQPEVVIPKDLQENWVCYAQDQAMTPISESVRKREYIQSIPVLQQLGVPPDTLLKELVRALGLPEAFFEEAQKAKEAATKAAATQSAQAVPPDAASLAQESIPMGPNNLQSIIKSV